MVYKQTNKRQVFFFKHFARKNYCILRSLHKEVQIGCLTVAMLTYANADCQAVKTDSVMTKRPSTEDVMLNEAEVIGSRVPILFSETANTITVLTRQDIQRAKAQSVNDLLKLCVGVDVRQRGACGIQTDISIGGGTFDQITILLNGICINEPQTGHLSADFPVAISDIERIEIYNGASARTFGSQALNGAINIITRIDNRDHAGAHIEGGSFGTLGGGAFLNTASKKVLNRVSADYLRSDGGTDNSSFSKYHAFYQGLYMSPELKLTWQTGYTNRRYGANTFYSSKYPDQWEANSRFIASVKGITNGAIHLVPLLSWVRSYDHFQLIHNTPTGENFHRSDAFSAGLTAYTDWYLGRTAFGGELRSEGILSTNLGKPLEAEQYVEIEGQDSRFYDHRDQRTNISYFLEHNLSLEKWNFSAGVMAQRNTSINERFSFYPGIDIQFIPTQQVKLIAAWNKSLRLPTFTDLYYKSPTQQGNVGLRAENASTFKLGAEWKANGLSASVHGNYRHGTNMIDWVMFNASDVYHSTNFRIDNYELIALLSYDFSRNRQNASFLQNASLSYSYNYQQRFDNQEIFKSNYALDYLRHKILFSLSHRVWKDLDASWYLRWQDRRGNWLSYDSHGNAVLTDYRPYALLSLKFQWSRPSYGLYASFDNITDRHYYDIGAVRQPGFSMMFGANINMNL